MAADIGLCKEEMNMLDNTLMIRSVERESIPGRMGPNTLECSRMISDMVMGRYSGIMGNATKAIGSMGLKLRRR